MWRQFIYLAYDIKNFIAVQRKKKTPSNDNNNNIDKYGQKVKSEIKLKIYRRM